jgi:tRNA threonylcarbamoyladenosine biosynthesis protein TsaE
VVTVSHVIVRESGVGMARLEQIGRRFGRALRCGDLVYLYGPLGAGKTTLVRIIAATLEVVDPVRSPSFTIANIYEGPIPIRHLDLYRLEEIAAEDVLALEDYVSDEAVTLVEWPEAGESRLGTPAWTVRLEHEELHLRSIQIEAADEMTLRRWESAGSSGD